MKLQHFGYFGIALAVLSSCVKETPIAHQTGKPIVFSAATNYENGKGTRTEYSGDLITVGSKKIERIDWVAETDRIRIICDEASSAEKTADYTVTESSTSTLAQQNSSAKIMPTNGNGLTWGLPSDEHYFFALYPAASMGGTAAGASIVSDGNHKATVTGAIPATQPVTWDATKREYKPDMNYAFMYAATKVSPTTPDDVKLYFQPLMTAFELKLEAIEGDIIPSNLTSVTLSSTVSKMSGNFTATLSESGLDEVVPASGAGSSVSISLGSGVQLAVGNPVTVTLFALPVDQKNLTLTLRFANGLARTLELKDNNGFIPVDACLKLYLHGIGVPKDIGTYHFGVTEPDPIVAAGGNVTYKVESWWSAAGTSRGIGWTAEFSTDNGVSWDAPQPDWLTVFTDADPNGSTTPKNYTATGATNEPVTDKFWLGPTTVGANNSKANALDLSTVNIYGSPNNGGHRRTANCYVVSAPGWYKFPAVYGNALDEATFADGNNAISYYNNRSGDNILARFLRHDGNGITNPWIKNNGITISSGSIVWQDTKDLISQVSADQDYVYFYVAPETIQQGNALVGALASSTIVWSWHIWVIEGTSNNLRTTTVRSHAASDAIYPAEMMNANLGWLDPETYNAAPRSVKVRFTQAESGETREFTVSQDGQAGKVSYGTSPTYQWGRKDPMLPADGTKSGDPCPRRDQYGSYLFQNSASMGEVSVQYAIQHPNIFIRVEYGPTTDPTKGDWSNTHYHNLWNAIGIREPGSSSGHNPGEADVNVVKTVYDPCPVGFRLPNRNAFTGFTTTGDDGTIAAGQVRASNTGSFATDAGYYFYTSPSSTAQTIFFPAAGYQMSNGSNLRLVANTGYYWTATPAGLFSARSLQVNSQRANPLNSGYRGHAFTIRPVVDPASMDPSVTTGGMNGSQYDLGNGNWQ